MKLRKAAAVILAMLMVLSALPASWADSLLPCRHQWSSWKTVTEATCASAGKQERTCGICHEKQTRTTGALGHNYGPWEVTKEPACEEAGEQAHVCAACGRRETREIPALGHEWDDGVVTREPTAAQPGIITYTCARDRSHIKEKLIPLGLNPGASALPDIVIICDYDGHTVYPDDELTVHYTIFNTGKHDLKWVSDTFEGDLKDMLAPDESFTWEEKYQITEQMIYDCIYFDPSAEEYITQWTEGSIPVCVFGGTAEYLAGDLPDGENKASAGYALNVNPGLSKVLPAADNEKIKLTGTINDKVEEGGGYLDGSYVNVTVKLKNGGDTILYKPAFYLDDIFLLSWPYDNVDPGEEFEYSGTRQVHDSGDGYYHMPITATWSSGAKTITLDIPIKKNPITDSLQLEVHQTAGPEMPEVNDVLTFEAKVWHAYINLTVSDVTIEMTHENGKSLKTVNVGPLAPGYKSDHNVFTYTVTQDDIDLDREFKLTWYAKGKLPSNYAATYEVDGSHDYMDSTKVNKYVYPDTPDEPVPSKPEPDTKPDPDPDSKPDEKPETGTDPTPEEPAVQVQLLSNPYAKAKEGTAISAIVTLKNTGKVDVLTTDTDHTFLPTDDAAILTELKSLSLSAGDTYSKHFNICVNKDDLIKKEANRSIQVMYTAKDDPSKVYKTNTDKVTVALYKEIPEPQLQLSMTGPASAKAQKGLTIPAKIKLVNTGKTAVDAKSYSHTFVNPEYSDNVFGKLNELLNASYAPGEAHEVDISLTVTDSDFSDKSVFRTLTYLYVSDDAQDELISTNSATLNISLIPDTEPEHDPDTDPEPDPGKDPDKQNGFLSVTKQVVSGTDRIYHENDVIEYTITLENVSHETLTNIHLTDYLDDEPPFSGFTVLPKLDPHKPYTYAYQHTVSKKDVDSKHEIKNYAVATFDTANMRKQTATSNTVSSRIEKPGQEPSGSGIDSCVLVLTGLGDGIAEYRQDFCREHAAVLAKVNGNTLKDSEDPAKALTGWNQVKELWRDELDKMYQQLAQKLPEAGTAITGEKTWFGIYVSAREGLLTARNPEQPALAAKEAAEMMMRQTAEICYLLHHAPVVPRPDSRIGRSYAQPDRSGAAECGVAFRPDTKASLILSETLCRKHTMFDNILTGLLKSAESPEQIAEVFSNSAQLYQGAYKLELTEQSAKAAPAVQSMLPYVLTVFETVMAQREQLLTGLYPDSPETVAELLSQAWREELSRLCQN